MTIQEAKQLIPAWPVAELLYDFYHRANNEGREWRKFHLAALRIETRVLEAARSIASDGMSTRVN